MNFVAAFLLIPFFSPAGSTQEKDGVPEFGAFPSGAIVYGKLFSPGRGIEATETLLRENGHFGLAKGMEDLFYCDRSEESSSLQVFGNLLSPFLDPSVFPLLQGYISALEDWGRGTSPEATQKAIRALEWGEAAVYSGGRTLQALHGDLETWNAVVTALGPQRTVASVGKIDIFEVDPGRRSHFLAPLPGGEILRSSDLTLLTKALSIAQGISKENSLRQSSLFRDLSSAFDEQSSGSNFVLDAPLLLQEFIEEDTFPAPFLPWLREAFRGFRGLRYSLEPYKIHVETLIDPTAPLAALLGGGRLGNPFLGRAGEKSLARGGLHLDLAKLLQALAAGEKNPDERGMDPQSIASLLLTFEWKRAKLWIDGSDRAALCLPTNDEARFDAFWQLLRTFGAFLPGTRMESAVSDGDAIFVWKGRGEKSEELFAAARRNGWLLVASGKEAASELLSRLRRNEKFFESGKQEGDFVADLAPLASAWNGDIFAQAAFAGGATPVSWLRVELGVPSESWKKVMQLWDSVRQNRPQWHAKFEQWLFGAFEPMQSIGDYSLRWAKKRESSIAVGSDRIRWEHATGMIRPLLSLGEKEALEAFQAGVEAGLRQETKSLAVPANAPSLEVQMDTEPLYEEILRNPALFRGFLRVAAGTWNWPWFSLKAKEHVVVRPWEKGLRIDGDVNPEAGLALMLSTFFDRYRPSRFEERAMARAIAVAEAEQVFQALKSQDLNTNGVGEFGSLDELLRPGASSLAATQIGLAGTPQVSEWSDEGYRYRLLLPKDLDEQERRWCLFAFPQKVDSEHHLILYIDERGFLMAGWQIMNDQEVVAKSSFSSFSAASTTLAVITRPYNFQEFYQKSKQPPEHSKVYDYFLPYLPLYGSHLRPGD